MAVIFFLLLLVLTTIIATNTTTCSGEDHMSFVFKGCSNETFPSTASLLPSLAALSSSLVSHSSSTRFFKTSTTTSSSATNLIFLTGLYQCRGDLPLPTCSACVRRLPSLWSNLCPLASAARVHLSGCYALYQAAGFPQVAPTSMLFRRCSPSEEESGTTTTRDEAFAKLESAAASATADPSEEGFYQEARDADWAVAGQCEGELSVADCGECLAEAVQKAEVECGGSNSGEMYLDKCFVLYAESGDEGRDEGAADASGGDGDSSIDGGGGGRIGSTRGYGDGERTGEPTQKTVAIVIGGAAGLGFLVIFMLFFRSLYKKEEY